MTDQMSQLEILINSWKPNNVTFHFLAHIQNQQNYPHDPPGWGKRQKTKTNKKDKKSRRSVICVCVGEHMFGVLCLNSSLESARSQRSAAPATTASREP